MFLRGWHGHRCVIQWGLHIQILFLHLLVMKVRSLMRKMYLQLDLRLIID